MLSVNKCREVGESQYEEWDEAQKATCVCSVLHGTVLQTAPMNYSPWYDAAELCGPNHEIQMWRLRRLECRECGAMGQP